VCVALLVRRMRSASRAAVRHSAAACACAPGDPGKSGARSGISAAAATGARQCVRSAVG
jgi:hypothetical protein